MLTTRGSEGFQTSRLAAVSAATLALLVLVTVLPATHFLPTASIGATGGGHGPPTSEIQPLPAYTNRQVVPIEYTSHRHSHSSGGGNGDSSSSGGVGTMGGDDDENDDNDDNGGAQSGFFTELFYMRPEMKDWTLYAPPWNPSSCRSPDSVRKAPAG